MMKLCYDKTSLGPKTLTVIRCFFQNEIDPRLTWFVSSVPAVLGAVKIPNKITLDGGCPST